MMNSFNVLEKSVQECGAVAGIHYSSANPNKESYTKRLGNIDKLGNVEYPFKSNENRKVKVPLEYAKKASKLVNFALESKELKEFNAKIKINEDFEKVYVPEKITEIIGKGKKIGSNNSRKLMDEVYLTACLHQCYDELTSNSGLERLETMKNAEFFKKILESL